MSSISHEDLRSGAQALVIRCMEPAGNTPGAQRRHDEFIKPFLTQLGVRVDLGAKDRERWLKDRVQSAGIARTYGAGDPIDVPWLEKNLGIAISAHAAEVIFMMDHTNCGERGLHWQHRFGRHFTPQEEAENIRDSLRASEARLRDWERRNRSADVQELHIVLAVGIVSGDHAACRRRLDRIVLLSDFLKESLSEQAA
jgi:hypothetical protein